MALFGNRRRRTIPTVRSFFIRMTRNFCVLAGALVCLGVRGAAPGIASLQGNGTLLVTNTFTNGVLTCERAVTVDGPWRPERNVFSLSRVTQTSVALSNGSGFFRSFALDLEDNTGPWLLATNELVDLPSFAPSMLSPSGSDVVSQFLSDRLSPATQDLLWSYAGGADATLQLALIQDLNAILQSGPIYDVQRFAGVNLMPRTRSLLAQSPQGTNLFRLNRLLLEDAYPGMIQRNPVPGFKNLVNSYDLLTTVAGAGGTPVSPNNKWQAGFEGGFATNAELSRPHIAMADRAGNIYIADKEAFAIRKVTPDGIIHTVAGINSPGYGSTNPVPATAVALNNPNGIWVQADGTFYILDRDNGLIRKVDTNSLCTLMVDNGAPIPEGRGLWVSPDEKILFYCAGTQVKRWDTTNGLTILADGFSQLGNLAVDPRGRLAVTDRKANMVYWVAGDGTRTVLAGGGSGSGGEGTLAIDTWLFEVRGIWFLPTGAFFLATDTGSQVWYVDTEGYIHLILNGDGSAHAGDGAWFYESSVPKVSKVRQIAMDYEGNLIVTENDAGYVRKVRFLPHAP
jgi:hypothetical protein